MNTETTEEHEQIKKLNSEVRKLRNNKEDLIETIKVLQKEIYELKMFKENVIISPVNYLPKGAGN